MNKEKLTNNLEDFEALQKEVKSIKKIVMADIKQGAVGLYPFLIDLLDREMIIIKEKENILDRISEL